MRRHVQRGCRGGRNILSPIGPSSFSICGKWDWVRWFEACHTSISGSFGTKRQDGLVGLATRAVVVSTVRPRTPHNCLSVTAGEPIECPSDGGETSTRGPADDRSRTHRSQEQICWRRDLDGGRTMFYILVALGCSGASSCPAVLAAGPQVTRKSCGQQIPPPCCLGSTVRNRSPPCLRERVVKLNAKSFPRRVQLGEDRTA